MVNLDPLKLLGEFLSIPAPPGREKPLLDVLATHIESMGLAWKTDAKGNLLVSLGKARNPILVTAHMDEIAMIVRRVQGDGTLSVGALGGLFAWKLGEGPVQILARDKPIDGVLSFGSIHTADPGSNVRQAELKSIDWDAAKVITGISCQELEEAGVRPGTRVVVSPSRRYLLNVGPLVAGYFLDDRADLVSWILAIEQLKDTEVDVLFAATAAEEVGGEGAKFIMQQLRPDVCIALELGPQVIDAQVELTDQPTVWATDSYSAMAAEDGEIVYGLGTELGFDLQFQALSRGGSDASAAANQGLCGRCFTLGLPMANSHGFEVMHPGAMKNLADLTVALVRELSSSSPSLDH